MFEFLREIFDTNFMPHGHCYFWQPDVLWPNVLGDAFTALAYYTIPVLLFIFLRRRQDIEFRTIFLAFAVFILACGTTHVLAIISVWHPVYYLEGYVKITTAGVSIGTVILLIYLFPQILRLPTAKQLRELNMSLEQKVEQRTSDLREMNKDLENFVYAITHDLRSPLKNLEGLISFFTEEDLEKEEDEELRQRIQQNVRRMDNLITDLLAFSRASRSQIHKEVIDMYDIAKETFAVEAAKYPDKNIEFKLQKLPPASCDRQSIQHVWQNLISNALKYSSKKDQVRITVKGWKQGKTVIYAVQDNGVGFDPIYKGKLFQLFQRLHKEEEFLGTGVGLATVQRILVKQDGKIWAESREGEGATFFFSLPAV